MKTITINIPSTPILQQFKNENADRMALREMRKKRERELIRILYDSITALKDGLNDGLGEELWKDSNRYEVKTIKGVPYIYVGIYFDSCYRNTTEKEYEIVFAVKAKISYDNIQEDITSRYYYIDIIDEVKTFLSFDKGYGRGGIVSTELDDSSNIHELVKNGYMTYIKHKK